MAFPLLLAAAVLHLTKDLDIEQAAFALLLAAVLWLRRQDYQAGLGRLTHGYSVPTRVPA